MHILDDLKFRGLINQYTDEEGLYKFLSNEKITLYAGFDPTADSLHIGHLVPLLILRRFQQAGHQPIALVGGATGLIGDPRPTTERQLHAKETVLGFTESIRKQLKLFLDFEAVANPSMMKNNYDWIGSLDVITFLRDIGKNFNLNYMLAKETVASRLETGISFTEFSYMILQSYDFLQLNEKENCKLQIGGSDQYGNITAGLELIRKLNPQEKAFGLTFPLVTKSDGTKYGKSEGNAVWLDAELTTPYEFYQFWVKTPDSDVVNFLKYFTFLSHAEINELERQVQEAPERRAAQKALAEDVTKLVHGEEALKKAIRISEALFNGEVSDLTAAEIRQGFKDVPSYKFTGEETLVDLLVNAKICPSKRQAREDITNGAIYVNGIRTQDVATQLNETQRIEGEFTILRRGKKNYFLVNYV